MSTSTQTLRFNLRKAGSGAFSRATGDIATRLGAMSQANASFVPIILPTYGMEGAVLTIVAEDAPAREPGWTWIASRAAVREYSPRSAADTRS